MAVHLVTFALHEPGADPSKLLVAIKENANGWCHYIPNAVLVNTEDSADTFAKKLYPYFTKNDYLLVVRVEGEHQGWFPQEAWDWLNERSY
jgi:hypothetical protein